MNSKLLPADVELIYCLTDLLLKIREAKDKNLITEKEYEVIYSKVKRLMDLLLKSWMEKKNGTK